MKRWDVFSEIASVTLLFTPVAQHCRGVSELDNILLNDGYIAS